MDNFEQQQTANNAKQLGQIIVGIDVGTTKIAVFVGSRQKGGKVNIIGMGKSASVGVIHGEVRNVQKTAESVRLAVEQAQKMTGIEIKEAYVGIAGHNIRNTMMKGTKIIGQEDHIITEDDIDTLINEQYNLSLEPGNSIIDIVPQDYIIDGETGITDPVGRIGKKIECNFNLISGDDNNITNIKISMDLAGIKVKGLILEPIASSEAVVSSSEKTAGICLVDIGGGTTDMAVFQEGILRHTAVIQLAGNSITNDIKEGFRIMQNQAEALKTRYGDCLDVETQKETIIQVPGLRGMAPREITLYALSRTIKARLEMILQQVDYELKNDSYDKLLIAGIVLTGGGSKLKHIAQYTEYITGITTRIGEPDDSFTAADTIDYQDPMYSTGIGLVLKGFEYEDKNSLPQEDMVIAPENSQEQTDQTEISANKKDKKEKDKKTKMRSKTKDAGRFVDKVSNFFNRLLVDSEE